MNNVRKRVQYKLEEREKHKNEQLSVDAPYSEPGSSKNALVWRRRRGVFFFFFYGPVQ